MLLHYAWNIRTQKTTHPVLLVPFFLYPLACVCMYAQLHIWEAMMMSFILLHVSMICVLYMPCMYGSLPSPNCLPFHMHAWKALVQQQSSQRLSSYEDELQNKTWRVLVQGSSHMHEYATQILLLLITTLADAVLACNIYTFLLVVYPTLLWCTEIWLPPACWSCANAGGAGWSHGGEQFHPCSLCFKHSDWALWWLKATLVGNYSFYFGCVKSQTPPTLTKFV